MTTALAELPEDRYQRIGRIYGEVSVRLSDAHNAIHNQQDIERADILLQEVAALLPSLDVESENLAAHTYYDFSEITVGIQPAPASTGSRRGLVGGQGHAAMVAYMASRGLIRPLEKERAATEVTAQQ